MALAARAAGQVLTQTDASDAVQGDSAAVERACSARTRTIIVRMEDRREPRLDGTNRTHRTDGTHEPHRLIPAHGGYRNLKSYQTAEIIYDATVAFCGRFIDRRSRTTDQMVQAARSGKQNIAEGSQASGTSKKTELKLTNVAEPGGIAPGLSGFSPAAGPAHLGQGPSAGSCDQDVGLPA